MRSVARAPLALLATISLVLMGTVLGVAPGAAATSLALDPSTPASVKKAGASLTTATFTPPTGSVLVISVQTNSGSSNDVKSIAVRDNLSSPLSYNLVQTKGNTRNDVYAKLYWAAVLSSRPMTVTATVGGKSNDYSMLSVLVFTGANPTSPIGASGGGRGATGAISDSYRSTVDNSWGWLTYGDWKQRGVPTVPSGESLHDSYNVKGEDSYALIRQNSATAAAGALVTMSTTSPASGTQTTHIFFEVVPAVPQVPTAPVISTFKASPTTITQGQSTTLSWSVSGYPAPAVSLDNGVGDVTGLASTTVSPGRTTTYTLAATNSAGSTSSEVTITVVLPDTDPPTVPADLAATAVSSSRIDLSWTASTDNTGVTGYRIFRGQVQAGTSTATTFADTGLTASTQYSYTVLAYDAAGNASAQSSPASAATLPSSTSGPEPAGWFAGDPHVHRSCGGAPQTVASLLKDMDSEDLRFVSLLADMGNGEVQDPTTDLPLVNGQDASVSTPDRTLHWDAEWHWDATYTQYPHQALGGHVLGLGLSSASQIWQEYTYPVLNWAHQQNGIAGFAHMQYLPAGIPQSLDCCTPMEYPVEVALGSADFISEDVSTSGDTAIQAYYRLLNTGFRPGFAAGTDYPCGPSEGSVLTYAQAGQADYRHWIQSIANGRTVVSRNGHNEFLNLLVNSTATPGDQVDLASAGSVPVTVTWTATRNLSGTIELVQNGEVIASKQASVTSSSPATLTATVDFAKSGWLAARRMDGDGHKVHTGAVFVVVNNAPIRTSA